MGRALAVKDIYIRGVIDNGGIVAVSSDWKVSPLEPWPKVQWPITRKHPDHPDMEPFAPGQALTLEETLRAYTWGAAYAINKEKETGSLEEGKYADMIVLDRNLFETAPETLSQTQVLKTVFAGELVYELKYDQSDKRQPAIRKSAAGGVMLTNPFGWGEDWLGLGAGWSQPTDQTLRDEYVLETFWRMQLTPAFQLTPGVQLWLNPSMTPDSDSQAVSTLRLLGEF